MNAKKKLNREDYMFHDKKGEELIKKPGDVNGLDFQIRYLEDCTVYLLDKTAQIQIDQCKNTNFVIGPVKGSVFFRDCDNCSISVACSQFRCRDLNNTTVYLYAANDPIIESSSNLKFAPYNVAYPFLDQHAKDVGFDTSVNKWELIFDFTKDESGQKKNFDLLDPSEFKFIQKEVEGEPSKPVFAFPYPKRYGGHIDDFAMEDNNKKDDGMMAFGFNVSQKEANEQLKQQTPQQQDDDENNLEMFMANQSSPPPSTFGSNMVSQQQNEEEDIFGMGGGYQPPNSQFQPMQFGQHNQNQDEEDLNDEEKELIAKAEEQNMERKRLLYQKEEEERKQKNDKKQSAIQWLDNWKQERHKQIVQQQNQNKDSEVQDHSELQRLKQTTNKWERVISNIEVNQSQYVGGCDVSRMRSAIIARKGDITKSGSLRDMI